VPVPLIALSIFAGSARLRAANSRAAHRSVRGHPRGLPASHPSAAASAATWALPPPPGALRL